MPNDFKSILTTLVVAALGCGWLFAEPLAPELGDWSPVVRAKAIPKAAQAGPEALPELLKALESSNGGLRHAATEVIALIARKNPPQPSPEWLAVSTKLVAILSTDPEFWVRCGAASALKAIKFQVTALALIKAAGDSNPWVAAAAVEAISAMPVNYFEPQPYLVTAVRSLAAPRSSTRSSAVAMIGRLGDEGKAALPEVEKSIGTLAQDSMFADKPRIEAIVWIGRFDKRKAATLANELLLEDRWGSAGRYQRILPFLESLGQGAAPAAEGLRSIVSDPNPKNKAHAARAARILNKLKS